MKRLIVISLIVALFSAGYISNSYAFGGLGSILKNLLRGSKNIADDIESMRTRHHHSFYYDYDGDPLFGWI